VQKDDNIYIFYNCFALHVSYWLKAKGRSVNIYYSPDINISMWPVKFSPRSILLTFYFKMAYNVWTRPLWRGDNFAPGFSNYFLRRLRISEITIPIKRSIIKQTMAAKFRFSGRKCLLLTGNYIEDNLVSESEYISRNDLLLKRIGVDNFAVKVHPRFNYLYSLEKNCEIIPYYVPANLLIHLFDCIVGYTTSVLFEAANMGIKSISLLHFFSPTSVQRQKIFRKYLDENLLSGCQIYYPTQVEEICHLLKKNQ
jgi:hypothetical protein